MGTKLIKAASSGGGASALNDLSDVTYADGDLTIDSLDTIVAETTDLTVKFGGDELFFINNDERVITFKHISATVPSFIVHGPNGSTDDYFTVLCSTDGQTTLQTNDADGVGADMLLVADGYMDLSSASGEDITFDSGGDIILDADGDTVSLKFGGAAGQIDFTNANSGDGVIQQKVDAKDLVVNQFDGNEVVRFTDAGDLKITNIAYFAEETANTIGDGATGAIDWNVSQKQKVTITGTGITCNFTNPPAGACNLLLKVIQGDGSDVIGTWDGDIKWPGGSAPTLSTGNGDIDIISFYWDGTNYFGSAALDFS